MIDGYKNITVFIVLLGIAILTSISLFFNKEKSKIGPNNHENAKIIEQEKD